MTRASFLAGVATVLATSAMAEEALLTAMAACERAVVEESVSALSAYELEQLPNGAVIADIEVEGGSVGLGFFDASSRGIGFVCGLWGHEDEDAQAVRLPWSAASLIAREWHEGRVDAGATDATNPAGAGHAAMVCDGDEPFVWMDAQPVWQMFRPVLPEPAPRQDRDPSTKPFRFVAHQLDAAGCAANFERIEAQGAS